MKIPLTVYKASAGSGKTFRLAVDYIKLLVEDPTAYRRILAVTFTNKATEEMKMRILTQLYGISHHCNDGETQDYIDIITQETGHNAEFVRQRAAIALDNLLHNRKPVNSSLVIIAGMILYNLKMACYINCPNRKLHFRTPLSTYSFSIINYTSPFEIEKCKNLSNYCNLQLNVLLNHTNAL